MFASARISFVLEIAAAILVTLGTASTHDTSPPAMPLRPADSAQGIANRFGSAGDQFPQADPQQRRPYLLREGPLIRIPEGSPLRAELVVQAVAAKEVQRRRKLNAVVEADPGRTVQVLAAVVGRVIDLKVAPGDSVTRGQELAIVYAAGAVPALPAQETGATSVATADDHRRELGEVVSDCSRSEVALTRSAALRCALIARGQGTEQTQLLSLKAPTSGSVLDVGISPGTVLIDPMSSIMTIADLDAIWVTMNLRKRDVGLAGRQAEVAFVAYPNEVFAGKAQVLDAMSDNAPSLKAGIELQNPARRLKPNMFAVATFLWPAEIAPVIPAAALVRRNDRDLVFIEIDHWRFEARQVEIGFTEDGQTVAVSGVNIGERIVATARALLGD